jgi:hypothetical protein
MGAGEDVGVHVGVEASLAVLIAMMKITLFKVKVKVRVRDGAPMLQRVQLRLEEAEEGTPPISDTSNLREISQSSKARICRIMAYRQIIHRIPRGHSGHLTTSNRPQTQTVHCVHNLPGFFNDHRVMLYHRLMDK